MRLATYMDLKGVSARQIADKAGLHWSIISRALNGRNPALDTIAKIEKATDGLVMADDWMAPVREKLARESLAAKKATRAPRKKAEAQAVAA